MSLIGFIFLLSLTLAFFGGGRRIRLWRRGQRMAVSLFPGLLEIPRRYFGELHNVFVRHPGSAKMHQTIGIGFIGACFFILLVYVLGFQSRPMAWLLNIACLITTVGAWLAWLRRIGKSRLTRLSHGAYALMPYALGVFGLFYLVVTLPLLGIAWPIKAGGLLERLLIIPGGLATFFLISGIGFGPMRHSFAGLMHLAFHPRPDRFTGSLSSDLKSIDLESGKLGVEKPSDFDWRQLLSFDACVQCGRCQQVCPAFAAGAPLNPKKMIFDLWSSAMGSGRDASYTGEAYLGHRQGQARGGFDLPVIGSMLNSDTLWACVTCRACVAECPMLIEHIDAIIGFRRFETLEKGATPGKGQEALELLTETDTVSGKPLVERLYGLTDMRPALARDRKTFDILLWLGEGSLDLRGQRTLRALVKILQSAAVDFAVLGDEELDCGDVARRLGEEALFQNLARRNIESLSRYSFKRILTCDPHVLHVIGREYPAFGGRFEIEHHTTFIARMIDNGLLSIAPIGPRRVTYHDPCYLGRYNGEFEAPRRIISALGLELVEMDRSGRNSFCCGWGGGAAFTDIPAERRLSEMRMEQALLTTAEKVVVACPCCAVMLEGTPGPRQEIVDVAELVAQAIDTAGTSGA